MARWDGVAGATYSPSVDDLGRRLLELLGERGCVELLAVLKLPEPERAALIGETPASTRVL